MRTSVTWINDYLDPPATAEEQGSLLTAAGFEEDGGDTAENGEAWQEVETTSNRGDCLCHLGLAREIAVLSGRSLKPPTFNVEAGGPSVKDAIQARNHVPDECPLYTARVIRGVKVAESPDWLKRRIEAIGLVPRNNLVDATNFVLFEYGQPTHIFDLAKLEGGEINIRHAAKGERMLPIGEGEAELKLHEDDLVIADANRPIALAGVKGGAETAVTNDTTDILLEAATFTNVAVRTASRRHQVASDSSYRFERGVHPADIEHSAERLTALVLQIAGGELAEGVWAEGHPMPEPRTVSIRPDRCRDIIGIDLSDERIETLLAGLDLSPTRKGEGFECNIPPRRLDLNREIDLIEEVARTNGLEALPVNDKIEIKAVSPQPIEGGLRTMRTALVGMGFVETVTHTLVTREAATPFLSEGRQNLEVDDERAGAEPALRPSVLPSLLRVARHNHDLGSPEVRLFETSAIFDADPKTHRERNVLSMVVDPPADGDAQDAYGVTRAAVERIIEIASHQMIRIEEAPAGSLAARGRIMLGDVEVGYIGIIMPDLGSKYGHDRPLAVAEVELAPGGLAENLATWPPDSQATALPAFPSIDRDLSVVLAEDVNWAKIEHAIASAEPELLEGVEFRTVYRGKQVGKNRKSLTFRMRFRAEDRTLRHEEVDPQVTLVRKALQEQLNGEVRD